MKRNNWLANLVEETMYKHYLDKQPVLVESIKRLLAQGESKIKIKRYIKGVVGKCATADYVSHMIDYVSKQVQN